MRWTPKVGQEGSLTQKGVHYVQKETFIQWGVQSEGGAGSPERNRAGACDRAATRGAPGAGEPVEERGEHAAVDLVHRLNIVGNEYFHLKTFRHFEAEIQGQKVVPFDFGLPATKKRKPSPWRENPAQLLPLSLLWSLVVGVISSTTARFEQTQKQEAGSKAEKVYPKNTMLTQG